MKNKAEKTTLETAYGLRNFLIPAEVLPNHVEQSTLGAYRKLNVTGQVVVIEGMKFLQVDKWQVVL